MPPANPAPVLAIYFVVMIFQVLIGSLIGAIFLRAAAQLANRMEIPFGKAYGTVAISMIIQILIAFPVGFVLGATGMDRGMLQAVTLSFVLFGILINAGVISSRHELTYMKAFKIAMVMFLLAAVIIGCLVGLGIAVMRFSSPY